MLGIGLIFAGFIILGIFGESYFDATIESEEFDECFEYFDEKPPQQIDCQVKLQNKIMFFGLVLGLVATGIISLVKGVKGKWDQDVKPEDMVGPGSPDSSKGN
jgi:hypothetical protein